MTELTSRRRLLVLATVCLAAFAINLDTTIVNVALPDLGRQLDAATRDLQWIVDGYNLAFAALVLTAGSLGDRFGRRPALLVGLGGFALVQRGRRGDDLGVGPGGGSLRDGRERGGDLSDHAVDHHQHVPRPWRAGEGDRAVGRGDGARCRRRAGHRRAAARALRVAVGVRRAGPGRAVALAATWAWVPESSDPGRGASRPARLLLSSAAIGVLVYTIIEAPARGWSSPASLAGFVAAAALVAGFVAVERRRARPMIDLTLFRTPAFSAASASVTVAFFALFGFIFLVTQYFQFIRGFGTLSTGVRILPVAITIAIGSVTGVILAGRIGTRASSPPG